MAGNFRISRGHFGAVLTHLGISSRFSGSAGYSAVCPVTVLRGTAWRAVGGVQAEAAFPPMAPSGGLFATRRCHRVETERGRYDRYAVDARFEWSAGAYGHGRGTTAATGVARRTASIGSHDRGKYTPYGYMNLAAKKFLKKIEEKVLAHGRSRTHTTARRREAGTNRRRATGAGDPPVPRAVRDPGPG